VLVAAVGLLGVSCGSDADQARIAIVNTSPELEQEVAQFVEAIAERHPDAEFLDPGLIDLDRVGSEIDELLAEDPTLLVSFTTSAAVPTEERAGDLPHVFASVNDPLASGLVDDYLRPGGNTTGVGGNTNSIKALEYLVMVTEATTVGILVDLGDPGSVAGAGLTETAGEGVGVGTVRIELDPDVLDAGITFPAEVDALILPANNRLTVRLPAIAAAAEEAGLPLAVGSTGADPTLALLTVEIDRAERVRQLISIVDAVLDGEDPGLIPVAAPQNVLTLNRDVAARLGLDFPPALVTLAATITD
jgi:putative ABC transport system substrate-binding protein